MCLLQAVILLHDADLFINDDIIYKLIGGLRSSMGYLGSKQIKYLRNKPQFVKITKAGFYESMVHNVDIVKNDTKY